MHKLLKAAAIALVMGLVWFAIWHSLMADDVARVKASIAYQYKHLRERNQTTSLEFDEVFATGFPFSFRVGVKRPTLSMVDGNETFAISIPVLTLEPIDSTQGSYRVHLPATVQALYAKNGQAPEHYTVTADAMPKLLLSAAEKPCGALAGTKCTEVAKDAPLVSFAVGLPKTIRLHMELGADAKDADFEMPSINVPVYQPIPGELSGPLQIFVGVLREALVFQGK